jgi:hypothetical protein
MLGVIALIAYLYVLLEHTNASSSDPAPVQLWFITGATIALLLLILAIEISVGSFWLASVTMRLAKQGRNCPAPVGLRLRDRAATPRIIEVSKQQAETAALHVGPEIGSPLRT